MNNGITFSQPNASPETSVIFSLEDFAIIGGDGQRISAFLERINNNRFRFSMRKGSDVHLSVFSFSSKEPSSGPSFITGWPAGFIDLHGDSANGFMSQPKSIGDDAQFNVLADAMCWNYVENYVNGGSAEKAQQAKNSRRNFIEYVDNFRAPPAQASATIQAAPALLNTERLGLLISYVSVANRRDGWAAENSYFGSEDLARAAKAVENAERNLLEYVKSIAATIQEPVMAAEPVGDTPEMIQWRNIQNTVNAVADFCFGSKDHPVYGSSHRAVTTCLTARDGVQVTLEPLAAPMVADPAGVALCKSCEGSGEVTGMVGSGPDGWEETRNCPDCGGTGDLAATVKAVPSEALALAFSREDWGIIFDGVMLEIERSQKRKEANTASNSDERVEQGKSILAAICKVCAAPLADKTGGGE